jgi:hypothetical protein
VFAGPVLPVLSGLAAVVLAALLALTARILPLPLALATIFLPLLLAVAHVRAVAGIGHAVLETGGAVTARRRQVLSSISTPQTRSTAQTRQSGRSLSGRDAGAGPDSGAHSVGESRPGPCASRRQLPGADSGSRSSCANRRSLADSNSRPRASRASADGRPRARLEPGPASGHGAAAGPLRWASSAGRAERGTAIDPGAATIGDPSTRAAATGACRRPPAARKSAARRTAAESAAPATTTPAATAETATAATPATAATAPATAAGESLVYGKPSGNNQNQHECHAAFHSVTSLKNAPRNGRRPFGAVAVICIDLNSGELSERTKIYLLRGPTAAEALSGSGGLRTTRAVKSGCVSLPTMRSLTEKM